MKFIELFAGIGGFRHGLERVCLEDTKEKVQGIGDTQGQDEQRNKEIFMWSNRNRHS